MKDRMTDRDWDDLSVYLDGRSSPLEKQRIEDRLESDGDFLSAYRSMRHTRGLLRAVPNVKRRRNFFLTANMVHSSRWIWLLPTVNFGSAAAGLLAVLIYVTGLFPSGASPAMLAQEKQMAPAVEVMETEQPAPVDESLADRMDTSPGAAASAAMPPAGTGTNEVEVQAGEVNQLAEPLAAAPPQPAAPPLEQPGADSYSTGVYSTEPVTSPTSAQLAKAAPSQTAAPAATSERQAAPISTAVIETRSESTVTGGSTTGDVEIPQLTATVGWEAEKAEQTEPKPLPKGEYRPPSAASRLAGTLLMISIMLAITGVFLRKRLR